jgi:hypothetical protein
MTAATSKQLCFDFMHTTPEQLDPRTEYAAYLRSIRDEESSNPTGGNDVVAKTKSKVVSTYSEVRCTQRKIHPRRSRTG